MGHRAVTLPGAAPGRGAVEDLSAPRLRNQRNGTEVAGGPCECNGYGVEAARNGARVWPENIGNQTDNGATVDSGFTDPAIDEAVDSRDSSGDHSSWNTFIYSATKRAEARTGGHRGLLDGGPRAAASKLSVVAEHVAKGIAVPPIAREWFCDAVAVRLKDPTASLDRILGLRSRYAGRKWLGSTIPERNASIRALAKSLGIKKVCNQAKEIERLSRAGKLPHLGKLPGWRQILKAINNEF